MKKRYVVFDDVDGEIFVFKGVKDDFHEHIDNTCFSEHGLFFEIRESCDLI